MFRKAIEQFRPRERLRLREWAERHVKTELGTRYSHFDFPHFAAPGGPMDAFDLPTCSKIWLQFCSRAGKSTLGQVASLYLAACSPCPMMFVSVNEKLAIEVITRTYKMAETCAPVRCLLPPVHKRRQNYVDFRNSKMFVGWPLSPATIADKAVRFGHANEVDKWEHSSTSTEADPLELMFDRFKQFPVHKIIIESTPATKMGSRIERGRLGSTNCSYWVPCPHCGEYQTLKLEHLIWDKATDGKSDKAIALSTARYVCPLCKQSHTDIDRGPMLRAGVWCPEGCTVDSDKARQAVADWAVPGKLAWDGWKSSPWIKGTPLRDVEDAGYRLWNGEIKHRTYGQIAAKRVDVARRPQDNRNFINQWLAETWAPVAQMDTWERLGKKIITTVPRYQVPVECQLLTLGADIQHDRVVYVVESWGENNRSHTIDYGELASLQDLLPVLQRTYQREGCQALPIQLGLIDSGFHPKDVYAFCRQAASKGYKVWPCKGSSTALNAPYRESRLSEDTLAPGAPIVHIDTLTTQDWISHQLTLDPRKDGGACTLFNDSLGSHQYFLEQLLNEACVQKLTPQNTTREVWERIDPSIPNDFRDCRRYAFAAKLRYLRGGEIRKPLNPVANSRPVESKSVPAKGPNLLERPGGWVPKR